jgi:hypothetical protein
MQVLVILPVVLFSVTIIVVDSFHSGFHLPWSQPFNRQADTVRQTSTRMTQRRQQAQPTEKDPPTSDAVDPGRYPKLIVFDLDNTIWTPELYQIRRYTSSPRAHLDVQLLPGARVWLDRIRDPLQKQNSECL